MAASLIPRVEARIDAVQHRARPARMHRLIALHAALLADEERRHNELWAGFRRHITQHRTP